MESERYAEVLCFGKNDVVVGMGVRLAGHGELRDPRAFTSVAHGAVELIGGGLGIAEREMGDRNQASAAVGAEVDDPAVVGARVGLCELDVLAFGLPDQAHRRVQ